jgi:hypothetical protein
MKKAIILLLTALFTTSFAADNTIYIDQAGDNATITILQDGASNRVRGIQGIGTGNTTPAKITGDAITIDVQQIGSGNILNMGIVTTTANGSGPTNIAYVVTGNNATGTINLNNNGTGINESTTLNISQTGDGSVTNLNILGSNNSMTAVQSGGNTNKLIATIDANQTTSNISQTGGGGNETTLNLTGDKGTINITTVGASNITAITQTGGGANGHSTTMNYTGSSNTTAISQTGTIDTTVNLKSTGSGNTFTVTSHN